VVNAYEEIGRTKQEGRPIPYSPKIVRSVEKITGVLNGRISSIRFETSDVDAEIFTSIKTRLQQPQRPTDGSYGAVRGRIQTLTNRQGLRFTLYDANFDRPVSCYIGEDQEDVLRKAWGKLATVEGIVRRDPVNGYPTTVRRAVIHLIPDMPRLAYRDAIGCAPSIAGSISPEAAVRRGRDA
jgi:hypothetical protein